MHVIIKHDCVRCGKWKIYQVFVLVGTHQAKVKRAKHLGCLIVDVSPYVAAWPERYTLDF